MNEVLRQVARELVNLKGIMREVGATNHIDALLVSLAQAQPR